MFNTYLYFFISILLTIFLYKIYPKFKSGLFLVSIVTMIIYIIWRGYLTIPPNGLNLFLGIILYVGEIISVIYFVINCYVLSRNKDIAKDSKLKYDFNELPTVDILIPTYGEPIYILKKTILGAIATEYNKEKKQIYVCDDSKRLDVKKLCEQLNVNYIIRMDNKHAKAGNLNHALEHCNGELTVVFDADMIAKKDFLIKSVHFFKDPMVGFVQIPQSFYNPDIFQINLKKELANEQDYFMRVVQTHREKINSIIHVGTNAIFRRSILNEVGKYPIISITEDIVLGFLIQAKGYKSILLNEVLALGLNPVNFNDLLKQRDRWCRGNLQLLKYLITNLFIAKDMEIKQVIAYMSGILFWYSSLLKMLFIILPIISLIFGITLMQSQLSHLLIFFIPWYFSQNLLFKKTSKQTRSIFYAHLIEVIYAPYNSKSCLANIFIKKDKSKNFNVTSKEIKILQEKKYTREVLPHIVLIVITLISWIIGLQRIIINPTEIYYLIISFVWSLYNVVPMFIIVKIAMKKINPYSHEIEIKIKAPKYIELKENDKIFRLLLSSIVGSRITVMQTEERILLEGEEVTLYLNNNPIKGEILKSINSRAVIKINEISKKADDDLNSIYIDNLQPYHILDDNFEQ